MTGERSVNLVLDVTVFAATFGWLVFIVWYWIRATWWKGPIGRNTMFTTGILFLILLRRSVVDIWPSFNEHPIVGILIYGTAFGLAIQRTIHMERAQRKVDLDQ